MSNAADLVRAAWQVDLGAARQIETEVDETGKLWIAIGPGVSQMDVWMKKVVGDIDLRLGIERTERGLSVVIDRGAGGDWWEAGAAPRLTIRLDESGTVVATATIGRVVVTGKSQD